VFSLSKKLILNLNSRLVVIFVLILAKLLSETAQRNRSAKPLSETAQRNRSAKVKVTQCSVFLSYVESRCAKAFQLSQSSALHFITIYFVINTAMQKENK